MWEAWIGKIPWRRAWQPTPVFLPGESPRTVEPGGLQFVGLQRVGHDWAIKHIGRSEEKQCWRFPVDFFVSPSPERLFPPHLPSWWGMIHMHSSSAHQEWHVECCVSASVPSRQEAHSSNACHNCHGDTKSVPQRASSNEKPNQRDHPWPRPRQSHLPILWSNLGRRKAARSTWRSESCAVLCWVAQSCLTLRPHGL